MANKCPKCKTNMRECRDYEAKYQLYYVCEKCFCVDYVINSINPNIKHEEPDWNALEKEFGSFAKQNDNVNHPSHYTQGGIETIDYLEAKLTGKEFRGYLKGNILKYMSRANLKNCAEDYKKAQWYLNKLIEVMENE